MGHGDSTPHSPPNGTAGTNRATSPSDGEVMLATMTDVQQAIEQLGRADRDGAQSFSFASSHGDYTDRSESETEADRESEAEGDGNFHRDARQRLAMRAERENQQRLVREAAQAAAVSAASRPPINVEMSDESEAEDEDTTNQAQSAQSSQARLKSPYSPASDNDVQGGVDAILKTHIRAASGDRAAGPVPQRQPSAESTNHIVPSEDFIVPSPAISDADLLTATAAQTEFVESDLSPPPADPSTISTTVPSTSQILEASDSLAETSKDVSAVDNSMKLEETSAPVPLPSALIPGSPPAVPIISPAPSTIKPTESLAFLATSSLPSPTASSAGSLGYSSTGIQQTMSPATTVSSLKPGPSLSTPTREVVLPQSPTGLKKPGGHPSEWSVDEVVEWLQFKGFDQGVCDKFIGAYSEFTQCVIVALTFYLQSKRLLEMFSWSSMPTSSRVKLAF